jgi:hypothetical protein
MWYKIPEVNSPIPLQWRDGMAAHSKVPNAGQKYASARKKGVGVKELLTLRGTAFNGRAKPKDPEDLLAEQTRVNSQIAAANAAVQQRNSYRY